VEHQQHQQQVQRQRGALAQFVAAELQEATRRCSNITDPAWRSKLKGGAKGLEVQLQTAIPM
jgi:hypothetical protein